MDDMDVTFWKDCADVQVDSERLHGQPTVGTYRVAAETVVEGDELGETPEQIADEYSLPVDKVRSILSYYHARQPEPTPSH